jgi:putative aldouronate transport system permease protein
VVRIKRLNKYNFADYLILTVLSVYGLLVLYPFYNSVLVSIVPQQVYIKTPFMLYPTAFDWSSYKFVFSSDSILNGVKINLIILVAGVAYNMLLTVMTGYALTKPIPGRKFFSALIIFTMYFGGGLIPFYILMMNLGLMNTVSSMILPTGVSVSYMLVLMKFFDEVPKALEESAKIDGANEITVLFRIVLPISLPILATFTLYYGVERWNEWWNGMLFIKSSGKLPLQMVVRNIVQDTSVLTANVPDEAKAKVFSDGVKMASIVITMLPVICIYPFLQKFFVVGLTVGAVKG